VKLDDLKAAWKQEMDQSARAEGLPMNAIMNDVKKINHEVRFRDFCMIFALTLGALLYLIFGWLTQENVDSLSRLGVLAFIAATTVMSIALIRARSVTRSDEWTLRSRIEMEIEKLEKQQRLMNRVGYWFLLPMLIANGISLLGGHHARTGSLVPDAPGLAIFATCALVYGFTYWFVRRETKRKWDPVLARLHRLHADLLG
jgi:drug/metabolite transporter (DMT)-like permease